jgi:hypothetical protein
LAVVVAGHMVAVAAAAYCRALILLFQAYQTQSQLVQAAQLLLVRPQQDLLRVT